MLRPLISADSELEQTRHFFRPIAEYANEAGSPRIGRVYHLSAGIALTGQKGAASYLVLGANDAINANGRSHLGNRINFDSDRSCERLAADNG